MVKLSFYNVYREMNVTLIKILEVINICVTLLFFLLYCHRLMRLRHFAATEKYKQRYNCTRTFLCLPYVLLSIPFVILSIVFRDLSLSPLQQVWAIFIAFGQIVDSILLIIQIIVLRSQLNKQRPYTCTHLAFCIYLTCLSIGRLVAVVILLIQAQMKNSNQPYIIICIAFYFVFLINSILLLAYWIAKRQELPVFKKFNNFRMEDVPKTNTFYSVNCNIEISRLSKNTMAFNYIRPTVLIENGKLRIILEVNREEMSMREELTEKQTSARVFNGDDVPKEKFKILSNKIYQINQIVELYKLCGRFNITTKLNFSTDMSIFLKNLQKFLQQFFSQKKNYLSFCLKYFDVPQSFIDDCQRLLRGSIKDSDLELLINVDKNASIISVSVFKQLWIDDYYLFYLDVLAIEKQVESRPMKRYHDFEVFHNQLLSIIKKKHAGKLQLPQLPKKYLFNLDQQKINHRRIELEFYLKCLTNDHKLMLSCEEIRCATLQFLGFTLSELVAVTNQFQQFYKKIQINKGEIQKRLTNNQYVTYYQFKILENGSKLKFIKKRFNDFRALHEAIQRWMRNTQISYKFLILPQKHLYKSGSIRHEKLKLYLESLIKIQQIFTVYEVNAFFEVGNTTIKDIQISSIDSRQSNKSDNEPYDESPKVNQFVDEESFESKERMSALIDLLGN